MLAALNPALDPLPPMGIYDVLFKFQTCAGVYMGTPDTHPWAQGFPLTEKLPNGPDTKNRIEFQSADLKYPPPTGSPELLNAIVEYYNEFYDANITTQNVCIFGGGKHAIFTTIFLLSNQYKILVEETEYTTYYDLLRLLQRAYKVIPSNEANRFRPSIDDYRNVSSANDEKSFFIKSNPCNPTGVTWKGDQLKALIDLSSKSNNGAIIDEAYEFFQLPEPKSSIEYIDDINDTNVFVISAATKGLQSPGARIGWVVASEQNIELLRNYSSICMGGVSRLSQILVAELLETERVQQSREAVCEFYAEQRDRYVDGFSGLGLELFTGDGGFYHWCKLPGRLTANDFNNRLFEHKAAVLPGELCDMLRRGRQGSHQQFFRFSFGPLAPDSFSANLEIISQCLEA